jgi:hypothetical protein
MFHQRKRGARRVNHVNNDAEFMRTSGRLLPMSAFVSFLLQQSVIVYTIVIAVERIFHT